MLVVAGTRQLEYLAQAWHGRHDAPRLVRKLAFVFTKHDTHTMGARSNHTFRPIQVMKAKHLLDAGLLPVGAIVGPLDAQVATAFDDKARYAQEPFKERRPNTLMLTNSFRVTCSIFI